MASCPVEIWVLNVTGTRTPCYTQDTSNDELPHARPYEVVFQDVESRGISILSIQVDGVVCCILALENCLGAPDHPDESDHLCVRLVVEGCSLCITGSLESNLRGLPSFIRAKTAKRAPPPLIPIIPCTKPFSVPF